MRFSTLEYELRAELNDARVHTGASDGSGACGENVWQRGHRSTRPGSGRDGRELRMIGQVEELRADLKRSLFGDFGDLDQGDIKIDLAGSQKNALAAIAKQRGAGGTRRL